MIDVTSRVKQTITLSVDSHIDQSFDAAIASGVPDIWIRRSQTDVIGADAVTHAAARSPQPLTRVDHAPCFSSDRDMRTDAYVLRR